MTSLKFPVWAETLFQPARYKVYYGGRGGAKSWTVARFLVMEAARDKKRILCARELQVSIKDSVHKLITDQIEHMGLSHLFEVGESFIRSKCGSEFIFKGMKHNINEIKSLEAIDYCWVEEAQSVSEKSWNIIIPTIRKPGSEFILTFNPENEDDPTYRRFVENPPPASIVTKVLWSDNPWLPKELEFERLHMEANDPAGYDHVWNGNFKRMVEGQVYGKEMAKAVDESRICAVPYNKAFPVITAWDLGFGDATAIWFCQIVGREPRIIDYYENNMEGLDHYVNIVKSKEYRYDMHVLPHDAGHASLRTGTTLVSQLEGMGLGRKGDTITVLAPDSVETGIQLVRQLIPQLWFDTTKAEDGVKALKKYHYEYDEERMVFKSKPKHDWSSNGADAMRYLATYLSTMTERTSTDMSKLYGNHSGSVWSS